MPVLNSTNEGALSWMRILKSVKDAKYQTEEEDQGRRQFLNGLGKWSVAIVAAVAALREGADQMETGGSSQSGILRGSGQSVPTDR